MDRPPNSWGELLGVNTDVPGTPKAPPVSREPSTPSRGFEDALIHAECGSVRRATEGTRNATLNQAAFNLAQVLPIDTWRQQLEEAATECGLSAGEIKGTLDSGIAGGLRNPRPAHRMPRNSTTRLVQDLPALDEYEHTLPTWPASVDWRAIWDGPEDQDWLLEPLLPAGKLIALYSPPKVGKSLLFLELAVAISQGMPALGAPTRKARVLYLDFENDPSTDIVGRLKAMGHGSDCMDNIAYHSYLTMPDLDTPEGGQYLLGLTKHENAELVIVDTISRAISGEENDNNTWIKLNKYTGIPLKREGIGMARLDHSGKDIERGQRGGSAKVGDVDAVWRMTELVAGTSYLLHCEAHRFPIGETDLTLTRGQVPLRHTVDTRHLGEIKEAAVLAVLDEHGVPAGAGRVVCQQVLKAAGVKIRTTTLSEIVKRRRGGTEELI